jgi:hypothetical protein
MPVNVVVVGKEIYFRTSPTGPLAVLATGRSNVAFGIDHFDATTGQGWNVTAWGETARVDDAEAARRAEVAGLTMPWAGGERHLLVGFTIVEIDGRRVSRI